MRKDARVDESHLPGLPAVAVQRLRRASSSGVRTSLLSVPDDVAGRSAGLTPVGEVMGCLVQQIGWRGFGGCGYYASGPFGTSTVTTSSRSRWVGYRPYVDALYRGYGAALDRLLAEARVLGADGVVGVRLSADEVGLETREFLALGTAVRGGNPGGRPGSGPFVTDLRGGQTAALMHAGWRPVRVVLGISVAVRHDDYVTQQQARRFAGPTEVSGYTELVQHVRSDARARFADAVARVGADGAVVSHMHLDVREQTPSEGHADHVAEARVVGTAIARAGLSPQAAPPALTVLPLRRR